MQAMRAERKVLPRAKILHGGYELVDESPLTPAEVEEITPQAIVRGRVDLEPQSQAGSVRLKYNSREYGIGKVETLEEREARYQKEVAALKADAEKREKEAYERGLKEGSEQGYLKGVEEVTGRIRQVEALLHSVADATKGYFSQVEQRLVDFAMMIARRIVGDTVEDHREVAVHLAAEVIRQATERTKVVLYCNPEDHKTLQESSGELVAISEGIKEIEVVPSPRISKGGVILETAGGSIDASIDTMLDEVHKALLPEGVQRPRPTSGGKDEE